MTALLVISKQSETLLNLMTQTVQVKLKNLEQEISKVETGVYFPPEIFPLVRTKEMLRELHWLFPPIPGRTSLSRNLFSLQE